jgi:hypothetical protein
MAQASLVEAMADNAASAVEIAASLSVVLDYTQASILLLEDVPGWEDGGGRYGVLGEVAFCTHLFLGADPMDRAAAIFGAYIGEVFRRRHGGEWVRPDESSRPALRIGGTTLFFVDQVRKRLAELEAPEDAGEANVWHFYQVMAELHGH